MVPDVHSYGPDDQLSIGTGRGGCYRNQLQRQPALGGCHPFDRRPLNPCAHSGPEARRDGAATRAQRALLTASTQGFRMRAPEGWPLLQHRAPPLTLRRVARAFGCGVECAPAPTWPGEPKEGSRRPARHGPPGDQPATGGRCAAIQSAPPSRGASASNGGQPRPGARSAPLK
jgi:hypothetical protein